tara:strand:- start:16 stop:294 length:279 start_codon:yes stop_codon:yes gene_type:complete
MFGKELGHGDGLWHGTSQLMPESIKPSCGGMGSQHQGESRWSANRLVAVGEVEPQASRCELIEMRRLRVWVAIAPHGGLKVINEKKQDIGVA